MTEQRIAIVGTGHAGVAAADTLRRKGFDGEIDLFGREAVMPYQRPPLSKQFLQYGWDEERLLLRSREFYDEQRITLHVEADVTEIDTRLQRLELENGARFHWDKLILATGTRLRRLDVDGANLNGIHYLQSLDDIRWLKADLDRPLKRIVVIGGGFIGLEAAAVFRETLAPEAHIDLVHSRDRLLSRSVSKPLSEFLLAQHQSHDVQFHFNTHVVAFEEGSEPERAGAVVLDNGERLETDLIVVGVGSVPEISLAQEAGLECGAAVSINAQCQTSNPDIYAIGDMTEYEHPLLGETVNLTSVQNAVDQARVAAAHIMGEEVVYQSAPWFWSDQYQLKLQIAGYTDPADIAEVVTRGDLAAGKFSLYCFDELGGLLSVESMNMPAEHLTARRFIQKGNLPTPEQVRDEQFNLKQLTK